MLLCCVRVRVVEVVSRLCLGVVGSVVRLLCVLCNRVRFFVVGLKFEL